MEKTGVFLTAGKLKLTLGCLDSLQIAVNKTIWDVNKTVTAIEKKA